MVSQQVNFQGHQENRRLANLTIGNSKNTSSSPLRENQNFVLLTVKYGFKVL